MNHETNQITRVVVRLPNWLGDVVMCVPALHAVRRILPDAHVTVVSRPGCSDIFIDCDFVDEVLVYDRVSLTSTWNQARIWRRRRFDVALLFQNAFEAAAIAFLARVPKRIGYDTERRGPLLTHAVNLPNWKDERHESLYYLNIVTEFEKALLSRASSGIPAPQPWLDVSPARKEKAREILFKNGLPPGRPLVLLCPGSINSRAKRWPAEHYAELTDRLRQTGFEVALIGSSGEIDVSERVSRLAQQKPILLTGDTTVAEAVAIVSIADLLITNDTGPAHIGAALNTPTIVIFGPTNPLTTYPLSARAEIIRQPPDCAPCMLRDCPIDHRCMTAITPEQVFEKAAALLAHDRIEITA